MGSVGWGVVPQTKKSQVRFLVRAHTQAAGLIPGRVRYKKATHWPWLLWLSGLSAGLRPKGSGVRFLVGAHAWVVGQVPSRGCERGNHTFDVSLPLSPSLPLSLKISK